MRALMSKEMLPVVWQYEATAGGFCEVTIEVNGVILRTEVVGPGSDTIKAIDRLVEELMRRC